MQQVILESSPWFILVCFVAALLYAYLLYTARYPWSKRINQLLFAGRFILIFLLSLLLLGPIVRYISNYFEKPVFVFIQDNSASVAETTDSTTLNLLFEKINSLERNLDENGFETYFENLSGSEATLDFKEGTSDLTGALKRVAGKFEGRAVAGVVLVSDGIYNSGLSPQFSTFSFPIYTLGVGDTIQRPDIAIKDVAYNKIAYQGNKFPIRAEVQLPGFTNTTLTVSLLHNGKVIDKITKATKNEGLLVFDFLALAAEQGIQRYDVLAEVKPGERNTQNNSRTIFIDVVEGKKKILLVAAAPHPDVKAMQAVMQKNANYEVTLLIPGMESSSVQTVPVQSFDLAILHQAPDQRGRTHVLVNKILSEDIPTLFILGQASDIKTLSQQNIVTFEQLPRQYDDVTPVAGTTFPPFSLTPEALTQLNTFPPVSVHFGRVLLPTSATVLLSQKVGSLATDKPLLYLQPQETKKVAIMLGSGVWRWRLHEYSKTERTDGFDELFGKLIQYLTTRDDKRKFRSYPIEQEFSDTEPVVFESQVYNDIFEPIFGNTIQLEITDAQGKKIGYNYVISPGNTRYRIGGLQEGVYRYRASTEIGSQQTEVRGQFLVSRQQGEIQNLTADFELLRKVAQQSGGSFFMATTFDNLERKLLQAEAKQLIRSDDQFDSIINLRWIFILLLVLVTVEWFTRKFFGGY